jgi:hypothetical protein
MCIFVVSHHLQDHYRLFPLSGSSVDLNGTSAHHMYVRCISPSSEYVIFEHYIDLHISRLLCWCHPFPETNPVRSRPRFRPASAETPVDGSRNTSLIVVDRLEFCRPGFRLGIIPPTLLAASLPRRFTLRNVSADFFLNALYYRKMSFFRVDTYADFRAPPTLRPFADAQLLSPCSMAGT